MIHFKNHRGTHSELSAQMWLAKQNYYVFKNIDNNSPIDVVAIKDNEIFKFVIMLKELITLIG